MRTDEYVVAAMGAGGTGVADGRVATRHIGMIAV